MCWNGGDIEEIPPHQFADGSEDQRPREYRVRLEDERETA